MRPRKRPEVPPDRQRRVAACLGGFQDGVKKARRNLEGAVDALGGMPSRRFIQAYRDHIRVVRSTINILHEARKLQPQEGARDPDLLVETTETLNARLKEDLQVARLALRRVLALLEQSVDAEVVGMDKLQQVASRALQELKVLE